MLVNVVLVELTSVDVVLQFPVGRSGPRADDGAAVGIFQESIGMGGRSHVH